MNPLLPAPPTPARVVRCRCCHRPVPTGRTWDGYGEKCARGRGLIPPPAPRIPAPRGPQQDGPDLLDLLADERHAHPMDATIPAWLTTAYPTARDWQPEGDNQWTASQPSPFGDDNRLYVRADDIRQIGHLIPADERHADVDAHIWKKLGYALEEAALPACVAPGCGDKGRLVFHAAEPGRLGGPKPSTSAGAPPGASTPTSSKGCGGCPPSAGPSTNPSTAPPRR